MGRSLQRCLAPVRALDGGQYTVETVSGRPAICCWSCEAISELPDTHRILPGGVVELLWSCPDAGCGASDFLVLHDIDEPVVG